MANIYWVNVPSLGRLAVVGRPRSASSYDDFKAAGIDVLVSMLEAEEAVDVGLGDAAQQCLRAGISFVPLPVTDHGIPTSFDAMDRAVAGIAAQLDEGRGVAAHCYAGLGRSPLLVCAVLIHRGFSAIDAIDLVSDARGTSVPEMDSQHAWLQDFAQRRLR